MNAHSRKLVKPGDVFVHLETGDVYKLLRIKVSPRDATDISYIFLDIKTEQEMNYSWNMFRNRLKCAPTQAQILYTDKEGEVKTGRENVEG